MWRIFFFHRGRPINPVTGEIAGSNITEQAERVMKNVGTILAETGTDYTKVVKTICEFLTIFVLSLMYTINKTRPETTEALKKKHDLFSG